MSVPMTAPVAAPAADCVADRVADGVAWPAARPRRLGRSVAAVAAAVVANAVVATAVDQLLHVMGVYPPWGVAMTETADNLLALAYRVVLGTLGGALAARLAPRGVPGAPMRHALAYGVVGLVLSTAGGVVAVTQYHTGPAWYPILLAAACVPCAWLGGAIERRRRVAR